MEGGKEKNRRVMRSVETMGFLVFGYMYSLAQPLLFEPGLKLALPFFSKLRCYHGSIYLDSNLNNYARISLTLCLSFE